VTARDWLASRTLRPPAALSARIAAVLGPSLNEPAERVPEICLAAAERLVADLLQHDSTTRDSALDLLTADALATYAFEAASERPSDVAAQAEAAMERIAALGMVRPTAR
jgi:hypothetical protein